MLVEASLAAQYAGDAAGALAAAHRARTDVGSHDQGTGIVGELAELASEAMMGESSELFVEPRFGGMSFRLRRSLTTLEGEPPTRQP